MHILWHSLTTLGDEWREYRSMLHAHLESVAREDTTFELRGVSYGTGDVYQSFEAIDEAEVVRNLLALRNRDDVDAVAVGNTFDPGVHQAREILDIPVLGVFETALLASHTLADRFAVVADAYKITGKLRRQVRTYGLESRVTGVYGPDVSLEFIGEAFEEREAREAFLHSFGECVEQAVAEGAELIIPGGGVVPILLHHMEGVTEMHGVPILDKTAILVKFTEAMTELYQAGFVETSRSVTYRPPPAALLEQLERDYDI